jgi:pimeloyl-ACP methyl ester carboxylesterase
MKRGMSPVLETEGQVLQLSDGRALGYAQYGDLSGWPVLLFQGTPTSRLPHNPLATSARVRLVVPERPGFGCSDFLPRRRLLDWGSDVRELVDHLGSMGGSPCAVPSLPALLGVSQSRAESGTFRLTILRRLLSY